jgi:Tol biopolymer transport system component
METAIISGVTTIVATILSATLRGDWKVRLQWRSPTPSPAQTRAARASFQHALSEVSTSVRDPWMGDRGSDRLSRARDLLSIALRTYRPMLLEVARHSLIVSIESLTNRVDLLLVDRKDYKKFARTAPGRLSRLDKIPPAMAEQTDAIAQDCDELIQQLDRRSDQSVPQASVSALILVSGVTITVTILLLTTYCQTQSKSAPNSTVANVVGQFVGGAKPKLESTGYRVRQTWVLDHSPRGMVLKATPAVGTRTPKGSEVTIYVSSGRIAFEGATVDGTDVLVASASGGEVSRLTHTGRSYQPAWSPNGKKIAFTAPDKTTGSPAIEIFSIDADGSNIHNVTQDPAHDNLFPAWSPIGRLLAFQCRRDGHFEICTMSADGGPINQLTHDHGDDARPTWSPDGTKIAFARGSGTAADHSIWIMNVDGGALGQLGPNGGDDVGPAWSPDGTHVAFERSVKDSQSQVCVISVDAGSVRRVTDDPAGAHLPTWSGDGSRLAFERGSAQGASEIWIMNADGTGKSRITSPGSVSRNPSW